MAFLGGRNPYKPLMFIYYVNKPPSSEHTRASLLGPYASRPQIQLPPKTQSTGTFSECGQWFIFEVAWQFVHCLVNVNNLNRFLRLGGKELLFQVENIKRGSSSPQAAG